MRKKCFMIVISVAILLATMLSGCVYEPLETDLNTRNIYPIANNTYDIGSVILQYDAGYFNEIYLNGVLLVPGGPEVDPVWTASDAFVITAADIAAWNALVSSQWVNDVNGINYVGSVGIHTTSSATGLLSLYSSDGISNDPVLSVGDNSASDESVGLRINMTGAKTDYTDGIYVTNICTTATAGADKYGIRIKNSGNWLGVGSTNYAFYIETPVGGTSNYSIYSEGAANYLGGTLTLGNILDMNTHQINNVVDPTLDQDAATKHYVDDLSVNYAGMYRYNSANATNIQQLNTWHLVNGFTTGYLGGGWTFHAGEQLAITAFADNGDGKTQITVAGHTLINSDIISISGTTSYNGVWIVEQVLANTFVIPTVFVANEGAKVGEHGSHFQSATATSAGKYLVTYSMSIKPESANCVIKVATYYNATLETKSASQTKLGAITDYQNVVGFSIVDVAVNGVVSLAVSNLTDAGDFTIIDGNMTLVKLGG